MNHILECHEIVKADFVRGENCHLYDQQGKLHVDLESGIWSAVLGHCHPRINQAMRAQMERVIHLGTRYPYLVAEEAALDVLSITERIFPSVRRILPCWKKASLLDITPLVTFCASLRRSPFPSRILTLL
jgi:acetylornithine/succinyldiaminopimelate/putrescine aminotransferase